MWNFGENLWCCTALYVTGALIKKSSMNSFSVSKHCVLILIVKTLVGYYKCKGVDISIGSKILKYYISKCEYTIEYNTLEL